jgi:hypothetical protein
VTQSTTWSGWVKDTLRTAIDPSIHTRSSRPRLVKTQPNPENLLRGFLNRGPAFIQYGTIPYSISVLRIRDVYPGSDFFPSRIQGWQDPGAGSASKNLCILTQKSYTKFWKIISVMFIPDPRSWLWIFSHPGSRVKKAPDPGSDPQLCSVWFFNILFARYFWRLGMLALI